MRLCGLGREAQVADAGGRWFSEGDDSVDE